MPRGAFAWKAIPWQRLRVEDVEAEVYKELDHEGDIMRRMYESTTRTWNHRPKFWKAVGRGPGKAGVRVYTDDLIYLFTDYGTKRHPITARRAPYLVWRWPSKAKTTRRVIGSHAGSVGKNWASKKRVMHPGTKAREFTPEILKHRQQWFPGNMQAAIDKGLRRARR
jgi:hypothetical protein